MNQTNSKLSGEDKFIIAVFLLGFVGSVVIYFFGLPSVLVAFFLATGISALVYRFLGGIKVSRLDIGWLRLGGSIAALVGVGLLINNILVEQVQFNPSVDNWVAVDKRTGLPIEVRVEGRRGSIPKPSADVFENVQLDIEQGEGGFTVHSKGTEAFLLGKLAAENLEEVGLFNSLKGTERFRVTERLPPNSQPVRLAPLPFGFSTSRYVGGYSAYVLADTSGNHLHEGNIYGRQAEIVHIGNRYYLVGVVEVNHLPAIGEEQYAKFEIRELAAVIEP